MKKGSKHSPKTRARMSKAAMGRSPSDETRTKISAGGKAVWKDPEYRKKRKVIDQNSRAKRSESTRKRWADPEFRVKCVTMMKAAWKRPDHKGRCRPNMAGPDSPNKLPERRAKNSASNKGRKVSAETRARMSRASKDRKAHLVFHTAKARQKARQTWLKNGRISNGQKRLYEVLETLGVVFEKEQLFRFDEQSWAIIDAYVPSAQLAIEYDGHSSHRTFEGCKHDMERDGKMLSVFDVRTLRIGLKEIFMDGIQERICRQLKGNTESLSLVIAQGRLSV